MKTCVFAGTFDPVTTGHKNIIDKCLELFDKVLLVVGRNPQKSCLLSESDRIKLLKLLYGDNDRVEVVLYSDYQDNYTEFLQSKNACVYARGIRNDIDLEFEKAMEEKNKKLYPFIKTEYINCDKEYKNVSSTLVKSAIKDGKEFLQYIPKACHQALLQALKK